MPASVDAPERGQAIGAQVCRQITRPRIHHDEARRDQPHGLQRGSRSAHDRDQAAEAEPRIGPNRSRSRCRMEDKSAICRSTMPGNEAAEQQIFSASRRHNVRRTRQPARTAIARGKSRVATRRCKMRRKPLTNLSFRGLARNHSSNSPSRWKRDFLREFLLKKCFFFTRLQPDHEEHRQQDVRQRHAGPSEAPAGRKRVTRSIRVRRKDRSCESPDRNQVQPVFARFLPS